MTRQPTRAERREIEELMHLGAKRRGVGIDEFREICQYWEARREIIPFVICVRAMSFEVRIQKDEEWWREIHADFQMIKAEATERGLTVAQVVRDYLEPPYS